MVQRALSIHAVELECWDRDVDGINLRERAQRARVYPVEAVQLLDTNGGGGNERNLLFVDWSMGDGQDQVAVLWCDVLGEQGDGLA